MNTVKFFLIITSCLLAINGFAQGKVTRPSNNSHSKPPQSISGKSNIQVCISGQINGFDFVDLGLPSAKKWATYNVGASSTSQEGLFFNWGSTEPQYEFRSQEDRDKTIIKTINEFSGNITYDAATKHMGGSWRTPTIEELKELTENCNWQFVSAKNFQGYKGTGPNGNYILLPCTSWYKFLNEDQYKHYKNSARYWSCTLQSHGDVAFVLKFAKELGFSPTVYYDIVNHSLDFYDRSCTYARLTIRAISD